MEDEVKGLVFLDVGTIYLQFYPRELSNEYAI